MGGTPVQVDNALRPQFGPLIDGLLLLLLVGCGPELTARPAEAPTLAAVPTRPLYDPDELKTVERRDLIDSVTGRATVAPRVSEELFFRRDGRIGTVEVAAGDEVEPEQVLARLEQTDLEYQLGLARLDVKLAKLRESQARDRKATPWELEIAATEVERAELALERLETEQKSLLVTAPYAGRITELDAKPGAEIAAYTPIGTIVGTDELVVVAEFTGPKAARIAIGQMVELSDFVDDNIKFEGTIAGKSGTSGNSLVIEPGPSAPELELGDSLRVTAVLGRAEQVLTIPVSAVKTLGNRRYVILVEQGDVRRVFVETGIETDGVVEIRAGLEEGQQVSER